MPTGSKITYYSLVKEEQLKKALFLGTLKASLGLIVLVCGLFIPAVLLIGWGLIPYRKLKKLQNQPDMIHLTEEHLIWKKRVIPLRDIEKMEYANGGILIFLKDRSYFIPHFSKRTFIDLTEPDHAS